MIPTNLKKPEALKQIIEVEPEKLKKHKSLGKQKASSSDEKSKPPPKKRKKKGELDEPELKKLETIKEILPVKKILVYDLESQSCVDSDDLMNAGIFSKHKTLKVRKRNTELPFMIKPKIFEARVEPIHLISDDDLEEMIEPIDKVLDCIEAYPEIPIDAEMNDFGYCDDGFDDLPDDFFNDSAFFEDSIQMDHTVKDITTSLLPKVTVSQSESSFKYDVDIQSDLQTEEINSTIESTMIPIFDWPKSDGLFILNDYDISKDLDRFQSDWRKKGACQKAEMNKNDSKQPDLTNKKSLIFNLGSFKKILPATKMLHISPMKNIDNTEPKAIVASKGTVPQTNFNDTFDDFEMDDDFLNGLEDLELLINAPTAPIHIKNNSYQKQTICINSSPLALPYFKFPLVSSRMQTPLRQIQQARCIKDTQQSLNSSVQIIRARKQIQLTQSQIETPFKKQISNVSSISSAARIDRIDSPSIQNVLSSSPRPVFRKKRRFIDDEAQLSENEVVSNDEDERYLDQDLSGFICRNTQEEFNALSFYRRGLDDNDTVNQASKDVGKFAERNYLSKPKLQYMNQCSSPFFKSDELSMAGSMADFVVNDSQGNNASFDVSDL